MECPTAQTRITIDVEERDLEGVYVVTLQSASRKDTVMCDTASRKCTGERYRGYARASGLELTGPLIAKLHVTIAKDEIVLFDQAVHGSLGTCGSEEFKLALEAP